jgi:hypothetical protein
MNSPEIAREGEWEPIRTIVESWGGVTFERQGYILKDPPDSVGGSPIDFGPGQGRQGSTFRSVPPASLPFVPLLHAFGHLG